MCKINGNSACPKIHSIIYYLFRIWFRWTAATNEISVRPASEWNCKVLVSFATCEFFIFGFFLRSGFGFWLLRSAVRVEMPQANRNVCSANAAIHQYIVIGADTTLSSVARSIRRTIVVWQSSQLYGWIQWCISSVSRISHIEISWHCSLENGRGDEGPSCDDECEYLIALHLSWMQQVLTRENIRAHASSFALSSR